MDTSGHIDNLETGTGSDRGKAINFMAVSLFSCAKRRESNLRNIPDHSDTYLSLLQGHFHRPTVPFAGAAIVVTNILSYGRTTKALLKYSFEDLHFYVGCNFDRRFWTGSRTQWGG
ncbi:hypothetical protein WA026_003581 [Henosepilachna vigintioctopunctata]|uniref:Uncharacterized protein n=1 Tax=Henosepilachna vigintioctopunctata TaxID=420089 RepID=A0AAW1TJR5_9CUCU